MSASIVLALCSERVVAVESSPALVDLEAGMVVDQRAEGVTADALQGLAGVIVVLLKDLGHGRLDAFERVSGFQHRHGHVVDPAEVLALRRQREAGAQGLDHLATAEVIHRIQVGVAGVVLNDSAIVHGLQLGRAVHPHTQDVPLKFGCRHEQAGGRIDVEQLGLPGAGHQPVGVAFAAAVHDGAAWLSFRIRVLKDDEARGVGQVPVGEALLVGASPDHPAGRRPVEHRDQLEK